VLGPSVDQQDVHALAEELRLSRPSLGVVMVRRRIDTAVLQDALRSGVREVVQERDLPASRRPSAVSARSPRGCGRHPAPPTTTDPPRPEVG
jgi:hypothetical protein